MICTTKTFTLTFNGMIRICIGITSAYNMKVLKVIEWQSAWPGGTRRQWRRRCCSIALPSSACSEIHFLVWCHNSIHLELNFQAQVHEQNLSSFFLMKWTDPFITQWHNLTFLFIHRPSSRHIKTQRQPQLSKLQNVHRSTLRIVKYWHCYRGRRLKHHHEWAKEPPTPKWELRQ
jgi:hypothetical protein